MNDMFARFGGPVAFLTVQLLAWRRCRDPHAGVWSSPSEQAALQQGYKPRIDTQSMRLRAKCYRRMHLLIRDDCGLEYGRSINKRGSKHIL